MFLASIAALALLVAEPPPASGAATSAAAEVSCAKIETLKRAYQEGRTAFDADDLATAKRDFDAMIGACGEARLGWPPRLYRAIIALRESDFDSALGLIQPILKADDMPMGATPSFVALKAFAGKKDVAGFNAERDRLLAASAKGLTAPGGIKGRFIEDFTVGAYKVSAFQARFPQEAFVRYFQFTITPPGDYAMPMSISVSTDAASALLGDGEAYFLDEYTCDMHATLTIMRKSPAYPGLKAAVTKALNGQSARISATTTNDRFCTWPDFIIPGLEH